MANADAMKRAARTLSTEGAVVIKTMNDAEVNEARSSLLGVIDKAPERLPPEVRKAKWQQLKGNERQLKTARALWGNDVAELDDVPVVCARENTVNLPSVFHSNAARDLRAKQFQRVFPVLQLIGSKMPVVKNVEKPAVSVLLGDVSARVGPVMERETLTVGIPPGEWDGPNRPPNNRFDRRQIFWGWVNLSDEPQAFKFQAQTQIGGTLDTRSKPKATTIQVGKGETLIYRCDVVHYGHNVYAAGDTPKVPALRLFTGYCVEVPVQAVAYMLGGKVVRGPGEGVVEHLFDSSQPVLPIALDGKAKLTKLLNENRLVPGLDLKVPTNYPGQKFAVRWRLWSAFFQKSLLKKKGQMPDVNEFPADPVRPYTDGEMDTPESMLYVPSRSKVVDGITYDMSTDADDNPIVLNEVQNMPNYGFADHVRLRQEARAPPGKKRKAADSEVAKRSKTEAASSSSSGGAAAAAFSSSSGAAAASSSSSGGAAASSKSSIAASSVSMDESGDVAESDQWYFDDLRERVDNRRAHFQDAAQAIQDRLDEAFVLAEPAVMDGVVHVSLQQCSYDSDDPWDDKLLNNRRWWPTMAAQGAFTDIALAFLGIPPLAFHVDARHMRWSRAALVYALTDELNSVLPYGGWAFRFATSGTDAPIVTVPAAKTMVINVSRLMGMQFPVYCDGRQAMSVAELLAIVVQRVDLEAFVKDVAKKAARERMFVALLRELYGASEQVPEGDIGPRVRGGTYAGILLVRADNLPAEEKMMQPADAEPAFLTLPDERFEEAEKRLLAREDDSDLIARVRLDQPVKARTEKADVVSESVRKEGALDEIRKAVRGRATMGLSDEERDEIRKAALRRAAIRKAARRRAT